MLKQILSAYGIDEEQSVITPFGTGLINTTWKVTYQSKDYILQRINHHVFKEPEHIAYNIKLIAQYLTEKYPDYLFVAPIQTRNGEGMVHIAGPGYFRLFPFIENSHTINVVSTPQEAFEAARQFGLFTRLLANFPIRSLKITIPDFHNLTLRYHQFQEACRNGNPLRIREAANAINFIKEHDYIVTQFEQIRSNSTFRLRVTHHDTKISNVLFDKSGKGLCVIDLDTVMPGYFISDTGDMMRTYLSAVSEEEKDYDKIEVREDYFRAIVQGYLTETKTELSSEETEHFVYAGLFMTYMQAIRFLADYLNNDIYYSAAYEHQNLVRATNQITLLQRLLDKENSLNKKGNY